jgi:hypothetical protein
MGLGLGRIKLDCADAVQVRGGAKNSRPFIVICPALTFFVKKVLLIFMLLQNGMSSLLTGGICVLGGSLRS